jgi:ComF family protein
MGWGRFLPSDARGWAESGIDLLFPPQCPVCRREPGGYPDGFSAGRPHAAIAGACLSCVRQLSADVARCRRCGGPCGGVDGCRGCRRAAPEWGGIVVLSAYSGALREAVLRAKRPAGLRVTATLAVLLVGKHADTMQAWQADCVVPVPMHWWRRSLRGVSAADDLAAGVGRQLGLPWSRVLARHRATRMQNELPIEDRPRNVRNAFRSRRRIDGKRILLVDDVMTTGATLSACCLALTAAGAERVDVAVIARADTATELPEGCGDA